MKNLNYNIDINPDINSSKIQRIKDRLWREKEIWLICIPMIIWVAVFAYYPMYGLLMAFFDYVPGKPITECEFMGLYYFKQFFNSPDFKIVLRNTLVMSFFRIIFVFPAPILLALLINEIRSKFFKSAVQTISYLPHFISWAVTASLLFVFLSSDGLLSEILISLGFIDNPINFLGEGKYYWTIFTSANVWKSIGWSSIIYLSAIAGIDKSQYEAAAVDGMGRLGIMRHITLPAIKTTIVLLFILQLGGILSAGFEEHLLLGSDQTREYWDVIDTYAYRYGIQMGRYSYGVAVSLFKSVIGVTLVIISNKLTKKHTDMTII